MADTWPDGTPFPRCIGCGVVQCADIDGIPVAVKFLLRRVPIDGREDMLGMLVVNCSDCGLELSRQADHTLSWVGTMPRWKRSYPRPLTP